MKKGLKMQEKQYIANIADITSSKEIMDRNKVQKQLMSHLDRINTQYKNLLNQNLLLL